MRRERRKPTHWRVWPAAIISARPAAWSASSLPLPRSRSLPSLNARIRTANPFRRRRDLRCGLTESSTRSGTIVHAILDPVTTVPVGALQSTGMARSAGAPGRAGIGRGEDGRAMAIITWLVP